MTWVASRIDEIWRGHMRDVAFASWQVTLDGELLSEHQPRRLFSGASMIKTPLAALIVADVDRGSRRWDDDSTVTEEMRAPGDGLLRSLQLPRTLPLDELVTLMIAVSDNTATNAVIDCLGGLERANARMRDAGWSARVRRWIGGRRVARDASEITADPRLPTAAGLSRLSLQDHQDALAGILAIGDRGERPFLAQQDRRALARWLDGEVDFAHKTGTIDCVRHDAGSLRLDTGRLWIGCFTDGGRESEFIDHPSCLAMAAAARDTLTALGLQQYLVPESR